MVGPDARRHVEVFADVVCPFAHVSLRRLVEARADAAADDVVIRVRAWPLELVNGEPTDTELVATEVEDLRAQVARDLFAGFDPAALPASSLRALGLATSAYDAGPEVGEAVNLALRDALFEQGRPIGDPDLLAAVAAEHGVALPDEAGARRLVDADLADGRRRGAQGSPHFFVGADSFFCPTLDIEERAGRFHITVDEDAAAAFHRRAFA